MPFAKKDPVLARLRRICLALPGFEEFVSFGHPGWRVGQKSFAFYEEYKGERCVVFKAELPAQQALVKSPRFFVAPYIGKHGWVSLLCSTRLDWKEIGDLVRESRSLVVAAGSPVPRPPRVRRTRRKP
jgi:predicted DNA-binding protein (MmcQ/YjbR family)